MTVDEYSQITGITVPSAQTTMMAAQLSRAQSMLETFLGYTLDPDLVTTNYYNEIGILPTADSLFAWEAAEFDWWTYLNEPNEILDAPDPVVGAYRLYRYNDKDQYFHVDPFTNIHALKLVRVGTVVNNDVSYQGGVTVRVWQPQEYRVRANRDGLHKYIEDASIWRGFFAEGQSRLQLAVDADWCWQCNEDDTTTALPIDLQYVLADMVQYYSDPNRNVRRVKLGDFMTEKFDNTIGTSTPRTSQIPELLPQNKRTIERYAGPYGSYTKNYTV